MNDKRGQGLSTSAIVLIVLGVLILVILILGFTMGWNNLAPWLSSGDNVKEITTQCSVACSTQSVYDFCSRQRKLISDDLPSGEKEVISTCQEFATNAAYAKYAIEECPSISCPAVVPDNSGEDDSGTGGN